MRSMFVLLDLSLSGAKAWKAANKPTSPRTFLIVLSSLDDEELALRAVPKALKVIW